MAHELSFRLVDTIERELPALQAITQEQAGRIQAGNDGWSRLEELGHLIDSAANNHVRFARAAIDGAYRGDTYKQNEWVKLHGYAGMSWEELVEFWRRYNMVLARVIEQIPEERLSAECSIGSAAPVSLRFLIEDYVLHMQHHLDHVLAREEMTQYPGAAVGV